VFLAVMKKVVEKAERILGRPAAKPSQIIGKSNEEGSAGSSKKRRVMVRFEPKSRVRIVRPKGETWSGEEDNVKK